jgi:hypothetical protein
MKIFRPEKENVYIFSYGAKAVVDHGLLNFEALRSHSDTPNSVGLAWTCDQPVAEISTWQHTTHTQQIDIHAPGGIRTRNSSKSAAADPRHRTRGHWVWRDVKILRKITGEELLQFVLTLLLLEWWKQGGRNFCSLYFVLLVKSTNKDLWLGKLKARFQFREDDIESTIILKYFGAKWVVSIA